MTSLPGPSYSAELDDGRLVVVTWARPCWNARVTRAGVHEGYRRMHRLVDALAGAGAPADVELLRDGVELEPPAQLELALV